MGGRKIRVTAALLAVVAGVSCALLPADPAAAHNSLASSDPGNGARLGKAPATVRLTFLNRLDPNGTKVTVTGPDNGPAAGTPTIDGRTVAVPVTAGPPGRYTVGYEVASADGHPVRGEIRFTVLTGVTPTARTALTPSPSPPFARPTNSFVPAIAPAPGGGRGGPAWLPWTVAAVVGLAAVVGAGLAIRRRRAG